MTNLENEVENLRTQMAELAPLSDSAIQKQVDAGADPAELLAVEKQKAEQRQILQFSLNSAEKRLLESRQEVARTQMAKAQAQQAKAQANAQAAIDNAASVLRQLAESFKDFEAARVEFANAIGDCKMIARTGGIRFDEGFTDLFPAVMPLDKMLDEILHKYRRAKPFNCQGIEPEIEQ